MAQFVKVLVAVGFSMALTGCTQSSELPPVLEFGREEAPVSSYDVEPFRRVPVPAPLSAPVPMLAMVAEPQPPAPVVKDDLADAFDDLRVATDAPRAPETTARRKYSVIATAEGLIGGRMASGVVITKYMQGAALPSPRGLGRKLVVTYLANKRVHTCKVLDVGPWNIDDPYWETKAGRPQAEAGRDRFGRRTNKAGIDLLNGTWYKLLGMRTYDRNIIENTTGKVEWSFAD